MTEQEKRLPVTFDRYGLSFETSGITTILGAKSKVSIQLREAVDSRTVCVIWAAEDEFTRQAVQLGAYENSIDDHIEDGYFSIMNYSICLTWSNVRKI